MSGRAEEGFSSLVGRAVHNASLAKDVPSGGKADAMIRC